jgi:hypothetical protein
MSSNPPPADRPTAPNDFTRLLQAVGAPAAASQSPFAAAVLAHLAASPHREGAEACLQDLAILGPVFRKLTYTYTGTLFGELVWFLRNAAKAVGTELTHAQAALFIATKGRSLTGALGMIFLERVQRRSSP